MTIRTRNFPDAGCSDALVAKAIEVTLSEPLGERELIDGACRMRTFKDDPTCRGEGVRMLETL